MPPSPAVNISAIWIISSVLLLFFSNFGMKSSTLYGLSFLLRFTFAIVLAVIACPKFSASAPNGSSVLNASHSLSSWLDTRLSSSATVHPSFNARRKQNLLKGSLLDPRPVPSHPLRRFRSTSAPPRRSSAMPPQTCSIAPQYPHR